MNFCSKPLVGTVARGVSGIGDFIGGLLGAAAIVVIGVLDKVITLLGDIIAGNADQ